MAENCSTVLNVKFYEFRSNSYWIGFVLTSRGRYIIWTLRASTPTPRWSNRTNSTSIYLNLITAAALVDQLPGVYLFATNLKDNQGFEIYRLICLMFNSYYKLSHGNRKWQQNTQLIKCSRTLPLPALLQFTILKTVWWTNSVILKLD